MQDFTDSASGGGAPIKDKILCDVHGTLIVRNSEGKSALNQDLIDFLKMAKEQYGMKIIMHTTSVEGAKSDLNALDLDEDFFHDGVAKGEDAGDILSSGTIAIAFDDEKIIEILLSRGAGIPVFKPDQITEATAELVAQKGQSSGQKPTGWQP